jgi:hypothetical protein
MGLAPGTLQVPPLPGALTESRPTATIMDIVPFVNIMPFGLCNSLMNPITAAQTAAALGALTPGACTPTIVAPWAPGSPTVMVGGKPALTMTSRCQCAYGGQVSVTLPGPTREQVA